MSQQELLAFLAHRMICLFSDPTFDETPEEKTLRFERDKGIEAAIEFVKAASRDEICADCGHAKHRSSKQAVSLEVFSRQPNARTFR